MAKRRSRFHILKRRFFRLLFVSCFLLFSVLLIRTLQYSSRQVVVAPKPAISLPDSIFQRLANAVRIPTVSDYAAFDSLPFRQLDSFFQRAFPLTHQTLERELIGGLSLLYKWPGRNNKLPPILLIAHLDVVPPETGSSADWTYPPFSGALADGFVWGRGTLDDKMSAVGILEAIETLLQEGYYPERTVLLGFGHDEEVNGLQGAGAIAQTLKSRHIQPEFVLDEGYCILEKALPGLKPPLALIGLSEKGYVTLTLTSRLEEGGHASMPEAYSPIQGLASALERLQADPFPPYLGEPVASFLDHVGPEMDLPLRLVFANRWLTRKLLVRQFSKGAASNALIRTTIAPTLIQGGERDNMLPTEASLTLNVRISPDQTIESVQERIRQVIRDPHISVERNGAVPANEPSPVSDASEFGFQVIQKTILEIFPGVVVAPSLVIGQTDARYYQEICPQVYRFSPIVLTQEDLKRIHGIDERISLENYRQVVRFYRELIVNSCK